MRPALAVPLVVFIVVAVALAVGLGLKPREIPSALIGKPVPTFNLEPVQNFGPGFSSDDLKGQVAIVNVFASWCVPCRVEHGLWAEVAKQGIPIYGLNYKDTPGNASAWLAQLGNPYTRTGADRQGRVGIDWGVYGVPETFVVDEHGMIQLKFIGPVDRASLETKILPKVRELQAKAGARAAG
jgi:cytochrome c biogenesis protein CcmG/thiol:disulfide interchange protein DsbE